MPDPPPVPPPGPAPPPGYSGPVPPGALAPTLPPPPPAPYELAGWWARAGAHLIDGLIVGAASVAVLALFGGVFSVGFFGGSTAGTISLIVGLLIGTLAVIVVSLVYAPLVMAHTNGQTWGKQALGIRVIRTDGRPMDFWWAALREVGVKTFGLAVAGSVSFGIAYLLDYLWPLWDEENRALHDMVVSTRVVRSRSGP